MGEKQRRTSLALSLTHNADVREAQGLIRGSLVSACLHIGVFAGCVGIEKAYRDCTQNKNDWPFAWKVMHLIKYQQLTAAHNSYSLN